MKFTFASFAALSLTATQATQLRKDVGAPHAEQKLVSTKPASTDMADISTSSAIQSLQKAFDNTQKEEKLLNEINSEIKQYWQMTKEAEKYVQNDKPKSNPSAALIQTKGMDKDCQGANCNPHTKPKTSSTVQEKGKDHQEDLQIDDDDDSETTFLQIEDDEDKDQKATQEENDKMDLEVDEDVQDDMDLEVDEDVEEDLDVEVDEDLEETGAAEEDYMNPSKLHQIENDIQGKLNQAEQDAEGAEELAEDADQEATKIDETMIQNEHHAEQLSKEPKNYKMIQIPRYAFTTDLQLDSQNTVDQFSEAPQMDVVDYMNVQNENEESENWNWKQAYNQMRVGAEDAATAFK